MYLRIISYIVMRIGPFEACAFMTGILMWALHALGGHVLARWHWEQKGHLRVESWGPGCRAVGRKLPTRPRESSVPPESPFSCSTLSLARRLVFALILWSWTISARSPLWLSSYKMDGKWNWWWQNITCKWLTEGEWTIACPKLSWFVSISNSHAVVFLLSSVIQLNK